MDSAVGSYALRDGGQPGWLRSNSRHSINEYCCTESVISVGSTAWWILRSNILGNTVRTETPRHEVADFSSYGTTYYGVDKPDVICLGVFVITSFSTFCEDKNSYYTSGRKPDSPLYYCMDATEEEPRSNYRSADKGTSMSSPVMAGIERVTIDASSDVSPYLHGIFDLYGRELDIPCSQLSRGLYIIDGRKVRI